MAAFCGVHFLEFLPAGDFKSHLNCNCAEKFNHSIQSLTLQTPPPMSEWQGLGSDGKGKVLQLHFLGEKLTNFLLGRG